MVEKFDNVSVVCKANVFFDGKVVSHSIFFEDGSKKSLGLIYPGVYKFNTGAPEKTEITTGSCRVKMEGGAEEKVYPAGTSFDVPGDSWFEVAVDEGVTEYVCSFG